MKTDQILIRPVLTEKATNLVKTNFYSFIVNDHANKHQIKNIIEKFYKVKVDDVRISIRKGKMKKSGRKMILKKMPNIKIAYIKLKEGKIDLFPQT